jgi:hypothetical protein
MISDVSCYFILLFPNNTRVFAGKKAPSVSWLKDDKHDGIRLRHLKVFPFSMSPSLVKVCLFVEILSIYIKH